MSEKIELEVNLVQEMVDFLLSDGRFKEVNRLLKRVKEADGGKDESTNEQNSVGGQHDSQRPKHELKQAK